jgi:ribosome-associated toxin RatA of RatAB toxin-antitoxin module
MLAVMFCVKVNYAVDKYQWNYCSTEKGCQVYTSKVEGKEYIAAKATCVMYAGIEVVGEVLRDIENYPEWMTGCVKTKMLKIYDHQNDGFIFWYQQSIPLMADRDMVLKCSVEMDVKHAKSIVTTNLTGEISYTAGSGFVRMPSFSSLWTLESVDNEHTRVTFVIDPHLGSGIPASVANPMIKEMPYKSLLKMMKMVKISSYIEKGKTSRYKQLKRIEGNEGGNK